jgi:hypothetical protein
MSRLAGPGRVSPGRPPPPSAKSTTGSRRSCISSALRYPITPCVPANTVQSYASTMARERVSSNRCSVDGCHPGNQTVGRAQLHELLMGAALALRGDDQRPVLEEAPRIDEVVDVLTGHAMADGVTPCDSRRAPLVSGAVLARLHLGQVGPDALESHVGGLFECHGFLGHRFEEDDRIGRLHRLAGLRHDKELRLHQVDPRDLLGDGVLDLQPRICLHEDEGCRRDRRAPRLDEELECAAGSRTTPPWPGELRQRGFACAVRPPATVMARPRSASDGGAGSCSRAPRDG